MKHKNFHLELLIFFLIVSSNIFLLIGFLGNINPARDNLTTSTPITTASSILRFSWSHSTGDDVYVVAISSDGQYLVAGSIDYKVYLFNRSSSTPLWNYSTGNYVYSVSISSDGQYLAAGCANKKVYLFDRGNSTPLWSYSTGNYVNNVAISSDGQYLAAASSDNKVYLFNQSSSTPMWSYSTGNWVYGIAISSDGQYLAAGSADYKVYLFNRSSSTPLWSYSTGDTVQAVAISSDGQYLVAGSADNKVYLFSRSSSTPLWSYSTGNFVYSVSISSDGQYLAAGSWDNKVYLFSIDTIPPTYVAVTESANPLELGDTETITISGVADRFGIQSVQISFEGTNHTMTNQSNGIWQYNAWTPTSEGNYSYTIYFQDTTGYWNKTSGMIEVKKTTSIPSFLLPFIILSALIAIEFFLLKRRPKW